jgi:nucleotide-binding universal stress UspA family protein
MFKNVLVGVDGRPSGRDAIALAAQLVEPRGRLTLAHVYHDVPLSPLAVAGMLVEEQPKEMEMLERERAQCGVGAELIAVPARTPGQGLHEEAERRGADLLVLGTCRHGIVGRVILGNDTRDAINGAPCAIAVAPLGYAEDPKPIQTVGVGYDHSRESEAALEAAKELAHSLHAKVRAREVVAIPATGFFGSSGSGIDEMIEQAEQHMRALPDVEGDAVYGLTGQELAAFSGECDLLIVGSRGYGPVRRVIFGSTALQLQSLAKGPLLILPRGAGYGRAEANEDAPGTAEAVGRS